MLDVSIVYFEEINKSNKSLLLPSKILFNLVSNPENFYLFSQFIELKRIKKLNKNIQFLKKFIEKNEFLKKN